ncbi:MAG: 3-deoxy-manno-octulosonate cytidylyltransferase [Cyclobacteriaceae bacterium]
MKNKPTILGVIPARYESSRFPGKPLVEIEGKTMIQRVVEQARKSTLVDEVIVATDDERIAVHVREVVGDCVVMTGEHSNGTSRCLEAYQKSGVEADYVVNIQGDEPFIQPKQIDQLAQLLVLGRVQIGSLAKKLTSIEAILDSNVVKVVFNKQNEAMYFSRSAIPYARDYEQKDWIDKIDYFKHIGMYAYRIDVLERIVSLPPTVLEKVECLEQLRWLDHGFSIKIAETNLESIGIDTPEDLLRVKGLK